MNIVLIGGGDLGFYLAQLLVEEEHDVIVIEKLEERCQRFADELEIEALHGDGTDSRLLEKANVKEADAVVAITDMDETNLVASLLAKELGAKSVACRLRRVEYDETLLKKLGIDLVIHPEAAAAGYIAEVITKPEVVDLAFISRGEAEILELQVNPKSKIVGKKIIDIEHPPGSSIIALFRDKKFVIPDAEHTIGESDKILVLAKREVADKVRKMLQ